MITIQINTDTLSPALARLSAALGDTRPLMEDLGELLVAAWQDRIERGEDPDGRAFAPRAASTLERYAAKGLSFGAPLNQSGDMRLGLAYDAEADFVSIGSNAIQAAVMQFGASKGAFGADARGNSIPWGDIPARPFIGLSKDDETLVIEEIEDWLLEAARGGGD